MIAFSLVNDRLLFSLLLMLNSMAQQFVAIDFCILFINKLYFQLMSLQTL